MRIQLLSIILSIPAILIAFTFHEYAHAKVADMLGDKTPRFQGRLTLNPFAHIDPIGFLVIMIFRFGWAKPVQINQLAFKNRYRDDLKVSIAGPLANFMVSVVFSIIYAFYIRFVTFNNGGNLASIIGNIITYTIVLNVNLFIFNLLPLPGLDGFSVLEDLLPRTFSKISEQMHRYQFIIFVLVIYAGGQIISKPVTVVLNFLNKFTTQIFILIS